MSADCDSCSYQLSVQDEKIPTECTLSHGKPCLACERQVKLRKRIEETKKPLDELITAECKAQTDVSAKLPQGIEETKKLLDQLIIEEREARSDVNVSHDPLQSRLPVEIVTYIFRLTLPEYRFQRRSELHFGYPTNGKYSSRKALILGAVCRAWRQTAWSTPGLWDEIMLTLHLRPTQNKMDLVKEWLERSSPCLLRIRLFLIDLEWLKRRGAKLPIPRSSFEEFASLFNEHSDRWEALSIQSSSQVSGYFRGNTQGAVHLKYIQVLSFPDDPDFGHFQLKGEKPKPLSIGGAGYPTLDNLAISWENIVNVELDEFFLEDYLDLLQNAPRLLKLTLENLEFGHSGKPYRKPASSPIQHNLLELHVYAGYELEESYHASAALYSVVFEGVTYPSMEVLTFDGPAFASFKKMKQCLDRSSCPLRVFRLTTKCNEQEALDLLYNLPSSIDHVRLDLQTFNNSDFDLDTVFDHLTSAPTVTVAHPLLPNLLYFEWFFAWQPPPFPIPWNRIPHLRRPLSGKPERSLCWIRFSIRREDGNDPVSPLFILDTCRKEIDETAVRGLIGLMEDGVEICLPGRVSREDLLAVLESH